MRPDPVPSARAAILWALAFFLGFQLALAIVIAVGLPGLGDPNYGCKVERLRQYFGHWPASVAPTHVVALGSSRTLFGLDAIGLGQDLATATSRPVAVFNFGVTGAGPITELLYLHKLLRDGIVPDLVLIEVLPPFLAGQMAPPAEFRWFLPCTRLRFSDQALLARYRFPMSALRRTAWRSWALPWHVHRQALLSRWGPSWLPYELRLNGMDATDAAGWVPECPDTPDRRLVEETNREHFAACFEDFRLEGTPAEALRELLAICRRKHIRAILVLMPETAQFRGWYPPEMRGQVETFLNRLGVPLIDARRWVPDNGFFDANHLHPGGAAILRRKLGRAVLPWLEN